MHGIQNDVRSLALLALAALAPACGSSDTAPRDASAMAIAEPSPSSSGASPSPVAAPTPAPAATCDFSGAWTASGHPLVGDEGLFHRIEIRARGASKALCVEHDGRVNARITPAEASATLRVVLRSSEALNSTQTGPSKPVRGAPAPLPDPQGCDQALPPRSMSSGMPSTSDPNAYTCRPDGGSCAQLACTFDRGSPGGFLLARQGG